MMWKKVSFCSQVEKKEEKEHRIKGREVTNRSNMKPPNNNEQQIQKNTTTTKLTTTRRKQIGYCVVYSPRPAKKKIQSKNIKDKIHRKENHHSTTKKRGAAHTNKEVNKKHTNKPSTSEQKRGDKKREAREKEKRDKKLMSDKCTTPSSYTLQNLTQHICTKTKIK